MQVCFRQTLHPVCLLPLGPALVAGGKQAGRITGQPKCLSCSATTHTWQHEHLRELLASGPAAFWG